MGVGAALSLGLTKLLREVFDRLKLAPEQRAQLEQALAQNRHELELLERQLSVEEVRASREAIVAETQSGDAYTRRARPTLLYIVYLVLIWNYVLVPTWQLATGQPAAPIELPEELFWLFGAGYLGYTGARSWDKYNLTQANGQSKK